MIFIALGANLASPYGAPPYSFVRAVEALEMYNIHTVQKALIRTGAAVPPSDQPDFYNTVVNVKTDRSARELLNILHKVEEDFGRVRKTKNEARVLDLDLLAYGDKVMNDAGLSVPHPKLHERRFVLEPLNDIAPHWQHPVLKITVQEMLQNLSSAPSLSLYGDFPDA